MQNSNFEDLSFNQLATQLSGSVATWVSTNSFPYMAGVMCRPDNFWYGSCQYPNTETCAYGPNVEFENVIDDFFTFGTAQDAYNTPVPNPTLPSSMMMSSQSLRNVTMIYPTNKITVDFIINVAWAPGCISPNGQVNISDPIGDGSISGRDVIRGTYYGCRCRPSSIRLQANQFSGLNFIASYDSSANTIDMVPGSAGKGYKTSSLPAPGNLYPGASNSGLGGWNQIGCLIYEVIPSKNRPLITENQGSTNVWIQSENWAQYQTVWPTLAGTYYNHSAWYCKPPPPAINYKSPPPCPAFPCPLGDYGRNLSQINNLIQTDQRCT